MSCHGWANSFFSIICKNEEQVTAVVKTVESNGIFETCVFENNPLEICLEFKNSEVYRSFDDNLEEFAKILKETFDLRISGYMSEEVDRCNYRCEFDSEGELHCADIDWLTEYSISQISEIQKFAEDHFKSTAIEERTSK